MANMSRIRDVMMAGDGVMDKTLIADEQQSSCIRQGFLCPICMLDMGDVRQLQEHVSNEHAAEIADQWRDDEQLKGVAQFIDLFGKTKTKLLRQLDSVAGQNAMTRSNSAPQVQSAPVSSVGERDGQRTSQVVLNADQPMGHYVSHSRDFRNWRDQQINEDEVETNKLIIRLDKLINDTPADPLKRKAFERDTVSWQDDSAFTMCPYCHLRFGPIARRKHHCRTCGTVLCRKLVNPAFAAGYDLSQLSSGTDTTVNDSLSHSSSGGSGEHAAGTGDQLRRKANRLVNNAVVFLRKQTADSDALSLASLVNQVRATGWVNAMNTALVQEGDSHLRVCPRCKQLLERRDTAMDLRQSPPVFVQFYDRLRIQIDELRGVYPSYCRMADSLNAGESMYTLMDAKQLKLKVLRMQEQIDQISRTISAYGVPSSESASSSAAVDTAATTRQKLLQNNVRNYAISILREIVVCMPALPDANTYAQLQRKYKEDMESRIEREQIAAASALPVQQQSIHATQQQQFGGRPAASLSRQQAAAVSDGWTADSHALPRVFNYNPFNDEDESNSSSEIDPLQQQIVIIKGYLRQAAEAGRLEEVDILERNLRELELELKQQQRPSTANRAK